MHKYFKEQADIIIEVGQRLYERGFVAANDGNISCRLKDQTFLTTPTGVSKGYMTQEMMVHVETDGRIIEGSLRPSSELQMHLGLYHNNPQINAVVHAHPPVATAFACAGLPLNEPILPEAIINLGPVPLLPYYPPGSLALAQSVEAYAKSHFALLLGNHGAITWGKDLQEALFRMETVEHYAQILFHIQSLGSINRLSPKEVLDLEKMRK